MAIKNLDVIARLIGKDVNELKDIISKQEEIEIEIPQGSFISELDLNSLKTTLKQEGYKEGKTAGSEMTIKEIKRITGLEFEGKDHETLVKKLQEKVLTEAKIEPEKKVKELSTSLESLQQKYQADITAKEAELSNMKGILKNKEIDGLLMKHVPGNLNAIKPDQALLLFKNDYKVDIDENNNLVVMKDGKVLKDQLEKPIPVQNVMNEYITSQGWTGSRGGQGGSDKGGAGSSEFKTINDLFKHMEKSGIDPTSNDGMALIDKFKQAQA